MKFGLIFGLLFIFAFGLVSGLSGDKVAYLYEKDNWIDDGFVYALEDLGYDVDLVDVSHGVDYDDYDFVFVGDERFDEPENILVGEVPSLVVNSFHLDDWGITDNEGVSQLSSNAILKVVRNDYEFEVYDFLLDNRGFSLFYYFLSIGDVADSMQKIVGTQFTSSSLDEGHVVSYAPVGSVLENGDVISAPICFYGIVQNNYWSEKALDLFEECVDLVVEGSDNSVNECSVDSDCGDDGYISEKICSLTGDVIREYKSYDCSSGQCSSDVELVLVESCSDGCYDGSCKNDVPSEDNEEGDSGDNSSGGDENDSEDKPVMVCSPEQLGYWKMPCSGDFSEESRADMEGYLSYVHSESDLFDDVSDLVEMCDVLEDGRHSERQSLVLLLNLASGRLDKEIGYEFYLFDNGMDSIGKVLDEVESLMVEENTDLAGQIAVHVNFGYGLDC